MADTFSALLGLRYQQTGGNDNTWGDLLNTDVFAVLEKAIADRGFHAATGGTLDLSAAPMVEQLHIFTGVLSSDLTVIVPALNKRMLIQNATTGAFAMVIKSASSGLVCIPQGTVKDILVNAGGPFRIDANDVGEIVFFGRTTVPAGYLECDGNAISRANYPELFAAIGTSHGSGNGATTFNLPDLKTSGRFLRSRSASVAAATYQNADIAAHNHTASAITTGTVSLSIVGDGGWTPTITISDPTHTHSFGVSTYVGQAQGFVSSGGTAAPINTIATFLNASATGISASSTGIGNHSHGGSSAGLTAGTTVTVNNSTGSETRPVNVSALACIRY
jgi:microcystin-dependent protein